MSDPDPTVECPIHGNAHPAFVCGHLAENPNQEWFGDYPSPSNPWPPAWCTVCNQAFELEGAWTEKNERVLNASMLCHHCYEAGKGGSVAVLMASRETAWMPFIEDAYADLKAKQSALETEYDISTYARWDADQRNGTVLFSNPGTVTVRADFQFVGSVSTTSGTWLWSWANSNLVSGIFEEMLHVRDFGEAQKFANLTVPKWPAEEVDGWEMAAVAATLLDAQGVYRMPYDNGFAFTTLHNVSRVS